MKESEKSLNRINKPTKIFGLKSLDIVMILGFLILCVFSFWLLLIIVPVFIVLVKNLHKAHKNGCPDFFKEMLNKISVKNSLTDVNSIMSKL